jgi:ATP-dependent Lon protease
MSVFKYDLKLYNLILSTVIIIIFFIISITINKKESYLQTFKDTIGFMGGSYFMSTITTKPLTYFTKSMEPYIPTMLCTNKFIIILNNYRIKFEKIKHSLNLHNTDNILRYLSILQEMTVDEYNCSSDSFNNICNVLEYIFILEKQVECKIDVQCSVDKIDEYLKTIQESVVDELKNCIFKPYICNMFKQDKHIPLSPIYLVGNSGVGKTKFVNTIAELLDIPVFLFDIKKEPKKWQIRSHDRFDSNNLNTYTNIMHAAKSNNKNSIILFIDEMDKKIGIDKNMITILLELINKGVFSFHEKHIDYKIDIKNIIIICCGNTEIEEIKSVNDNMGIEALANRFITIKFPDIDNSLKTTIVEKYIKTNYPFLNYKKHSEEINKIVNNDNEPGMRKLMINIDLFMNKYISFEVFKGTVWEDA